MSTENQSGAQVTQTTDGAQVDDPNSFAAGFKAGAVDGPQFAPGVVVDPPQAAQPTEQPGEGPGAQQAQDGQGAAVGGDQNISGQGVDTSGNGAQVASQSQELNLDGLPDEVRQHVESLRTRQQELESQAADLRRNLDAQNGRVAPLQRELDSTKRELARIQTPRTQTQQQPQPQQQRAVPSAVDVANAQFETDSFKAYEKLYPEEAALQKANAIAVAKATDQRMAYLESLVGQTFSRVGQIEADRQQAHRREEIVELDRVHPDWREINASDDFWNWYAPREHMFGFTSDEQRQRRFEDRKFVTSLLDDYKAHRDRDALRAGNGGGAQTTTQQTTQPQGQQQQQTIDPSLTLSAQPSIRGGGVRRTGGTEQKGNDFMAGYNSVANL